jgi:hypothetical protein
MTECINDTACSCEAVYDVRPTISIQHDIPYEQYLTSSRLWLKRLQRGLIIISKLFSQYNWFNEEVDVKQMEMRTRNEYNPKTRIPGL